MVFRRRWGADTSLESAQALADHPLKSLSLIPTASQASTLNTSLIKLPSIFQSGKERPDPSHHPKLKSATYDTLVHRRRAKGGRNPGHMPCLCNQPRATSMMFITFLMLIPCSLSSASQRSWVLNLKDSQGSGLFVIPVYRVTVNSITSIPRCCNNRKQSLKSCGNQNSHSAPVEEAALFAPDIQD